MVANAEMAGCTSEDDDIAAALIGILSRKRKRRRPKTVWTRDWINARYKHGAFTTLIPQFSISDKLSYKNFFRMDAESFRLLLDKVTRLVVKQDTNMRSAVDSAERLTVALRYLATGDSFISLSYLFRLGRSTIGNIVIEVCEAIVTALERDYLKTPNTEAEWKSIAEVFATQWNFPNCIGALDGKHIRILPPANSGSEFYNYKHFHSIVLMALVDAQYRFQFVDVGSYGRVSDGGVFSTCELDNALTNNTLNVPAACCLPQSDILAPYVVVADDAFALKKHLMKPYPSKHLTREQRLYNYRLGRARRVVENAFGIMAARFRVFSTPIPLFPDKVQTIVLAACCLHNFLLRNPASSSHYVSLADDIDAAADLQPLGRQPARKSSNEAKAVRDNFCAYFSSEAGAVSWQDRATGLMH